MKRAAMILAGAIALIAAPVTAENKRKPPPTKGEVKLAKMLQGRVAGEAKSCIRQFGSDRMTVIDGTAIVFKRGKTLWVNYTKRPSRIDNDDIMVFRRFGSSSRLCRTDLISTVDRYAGFQTGNIFLADFVPYRKVEK